jgi:triacylglycerol lipase
MPDKPPTSTTTERVVLLHGMCRTASSMRPMQRALEEAGFEVLNVGYPSRTATVEKLSESVIGPLFADRQPASGKIHFVTHSLGGILVRQYAANHPEARIGNVVMLAPPNRGSEVVDRIGPWRMFSFINGPAGRQLGTDADSVPNRLGPANFHAGVIAGRRTINWINSLMIEGPDDGKVSVERTKLEGMADHLVVPATHPMIMRNREVMAQTIEFLRHGKFSRR